MELELDTDWLEVQNRLSNIDSKHVKETMKSIYIHYVYIDLKKSLSKILTEKQELLILDHNSYITRENILKIIQTKKIYNNNKHKLHEILLYNVDLEPDNVQSFANSKENSLSFLRPLSFVDEIKIPSTLFIFHQFNCIYIIYQEIGDIEFHKKTKKVQFSCDNDIKLRQQTCKKREKK